MKATASRIVRVTLAVGALVATLLLANPSPASAHATLLFTSPAANTAVADAPKVVQLVFDEEVVASDSSMRITGERGTETETEVGTIRQVDATTIRAPIPQTLQPGTYAVSWQAGADDGDLMSGAFDFVIGDEKALTAGQATSSASDSMVVAIARWTMWLGLALSLGGLAGERIVRRVEHRPARQAGRLLVPGGLVLGLLGSLGGLILYATSGAPVGGLVAHVAGSTPGRVLLIELAAFMLGMVGAATRLTAPRGSILLLALLAVPVAEGFRAHPANSTTWGVVFTAVHLTAAAVWLGGLAKVLWVARALRASGRAAGPVRIAPGFVEARLVGSGLDEDGCLRVVLDAVLSPVSGLELGGWDMADLAVQAPVVEPVDVFGDGDLDVSDGLPATSRAHHGVPDALGFEQRVQRFGHGVVIRIAL